MRKVYCYAKKEEKPEEIDHSGDIVQDLSGLDISDLKNKRFFFMGGEIIENPYYEPSEYMKCVYAMIDAQYEQFYRSDKDKKDSEDEPNKLSSDDEMPDWIAEMRYGELIKRFPGGISEALEYAKKEKGLSVPEVHYNSPEPEKLGVKAFTKNAEVYLAPGEGEETLKHELGHVVQQKKEKIPATTKIGEQQVNLDPKLEQEADEFAKHIEDHIPEIISEKPTDVKTNDVIQFELPEREELWPQIEAEAKNMGISENFINQELVKSAIMNKVEEYYKSFMWWAWWRMTYKNDNYLDTCIIWGLNSIKSENSEECNLYSELENSKLEDNEEEKARITEIMAMLSTESIFPEDFDSYVTLHVAMQRMTPEQCSKVKEYILVLKDYCDKEGVKGVLESADINVSKSRLMLVKGDSENLYDENKANYFIKRLELMTYYIVRVAKEEIDSDDGKPFKEKYWVRSTGSDPHHDGQHALFLVNKQNQKGYKTDIRKRAGEVAKVYKPHDLRADDAVVGEKGILSQLNNLFKTDKLLSKTDEYKDELESLTKKLGLFIEKNEDIFATINIYTSNHTEEYVTKQRSASEQEAKKYFFCVGMLEAIAQLAAIIDLHFDNIIPVRKGNSILPLIIDAEVDFFHYGTGTQLLNAMNTDEANGLATNSSFEINNALSGELFQSKYSKLYKQGFDFLVKFIDYDNFSKVFKEVLNNLPGEKPEDVRIRLVPLPTPEFGNYLDKAITNKYKVDSIIQEMADKIKQIKMLDIGITQENTESTVKLEFNDDDLKAKLRKTIENGTIPAMYADMAGNLYLDDKNVGKIGDINNSKSMVDLMLKCSSKMLDNLRKKSKEIGKK